jgi:hypothetical protein
MQVTVSRSGSTTVSPTVTPSASVTPSVTQVWALPAGNTGITGISISLPLSVSLSLCLSVSLSLSHSLSRYLSLPLPRPHTHAHPQLVANGTLLPLTLAHKRGTPLLPMQQCVWSQSTNPRLHVATPAFFLVLLLPAVGVSQRDGHQISLRLPVPVPLPILRATHHHLQGQ